MKQLLEEHYGKVTLVALVLSGVLISASTYYFRDTSRAIMIDPCIDMDGDGYGQTSSPVCPKAPELDCDDTNALRNPGIPGSCDPSYNTNTGTGATNVNVNASNSNTNIPVDTNTNTNTSVNDNQNSSTVNMNTNTITDTDGDGVGDDDDLCQNTPRDEVESDEKQSKTENGTYLYRKGAFVQKDGKKFISSRYTIQQTKGCTCQQMKERDERTSKNKERNASCDDDYMKKWSESHKNRGENSSSSHDREERSSSGYRQEGKERR